MIHPKTRARVIERAMKMGYQGRARRVERQKKVQTTLGVMIPGYRNDPSHLDINFTRYLQGIMAAADGNGVLLHLKGLPLAEEKTAENPFMSWSDLNLEMCHAVIVLSYSSPSSLASILEHIPVVCISWVYPGLGHDSVTADDVDGIRNLVKQLAKHGHRRMAWVGEWYPAPFFEARQTGFIQGCLGHDINIGEQKFFGCDSFNEKFTLNSGPIFGAVKAGTTAFVCANDRVALEIIHLLETNGVRVPEDVSVTGFDALGLRASNGKELTTIDPKFIEVGRAAVKLALQRLSDPSASQIKWIISGNEIPGQTLGTKQG